jgi:hypothetical protein
MPDFAFCFNAVMCNVGYYSPVVFFIDTTFFGPTGHLQVYRLLWLRNLPLTVMLFCFSYVASSDYIWLCGLHIDDIETKRNVCSMQCNRMLQYNIMDLGCIIKWYRPHMKFVISVFRNWKVSSEVFVKEIHLLNREPEKN